MTLSAAYYRGSDAAFAGNKRDPGEVASETEAHDWLKGYDDAMAYILSRIDESAWEGIR